MSLKATVIQSFAKFILGSGTFEKVKEIVLEQENTSLKGEAKRKAAIEEIKSIGLKIASWAVSLAIELAVSYFRTKAGETINVKQS